MARRKRLGRIRYSYLRGERLPGVGFDDQETQLIQHRPSSWVARARSFAFRRGGARTVSQKATDGEYRSYGMPVFDRNAGQAELNDYLRRGG